MPPPEPQDRPAKALLDPHPVAVGACGRDVPRMVERALGAARVRLALQPVVAADGRRVAFYEGLVRLLDETGRILPARSFLPSVGEDQLGRDLDRVALEAGFGLLSRRADLRLSINMSARSIDDGAWRGTLDRWLARSPELASRLILEMTEASAMLLPELTVRFMEEMQPKGVCFALDDFGSGAVAFRHMQDFLFDLVKIDRRLGDGLDHLPDHQAIVGTLLSIARRFEMFTVAQGVETEAVARLYTTLGADCLQGFHIGSPRLAA